MKSHSEIIENAKSLLEDAEILAEKDKWGSAMALSVLCVEECGKFIQSNRDFSDTALAQMNLSHREKQKTSILHAFTISLNRALALVGLKISYPEELSPRQQKWLAGEEGQKLNAAFFGRKGEFDIPEEVAGKMVDTLGSEENRVGLLHLAEIVSPGHMEKAKHKGLYVDISKTGKIKSVPQEVTESEARQFLELAQHVVADLEQLKDQGVWKSND
jgi:AbiV family abortive infection protein